MSASIDSREIRNRLLRALPEDARDHLLQRANLVDLPRGKVLYHPDDEMPTVYFLNHGLVSLVLEMKDGRLVEVGARGSDGVTTPEVLVDLPRAVFTGVVQIPCSALAVETRIVRRAIEEWPRMKELVHGFFHVAILQLGQTAACNRLHSLEQRCCRWLLIAYDAAGADTFPLTHEFLAMVLGAPRPGVSLAAHTLRKAGYIDYRRGIVTVTDHAGLEAAACECYGRIRRSLDRLLVPKN